jgi:CheY-like chemotaxis protein
VNTALKTIVVEDKGPVAELLSDRLRGLGHEVCGVAPTALELAGLLEDHRPDVVLIDLELGERQDGIGIATLLEAGGPLPVVFVVDPDAERAEVEESRTVQCSARLARPFTDEDLAQAVDRAVSKVQTAAHPKL